MHACAYPWAWLLTGGGDFSAVCKLSWPVVTGFFLHEILWTRIPCAFRAAVLERTDVPCVVQILTLINYCGNNPLVDGIYYYFSPQRKKRLLLPAFKCQWSSSLYLYMWRCTVRGETPAIIDRDDEEVLRGRGGINKYPDSWTTLHVTSNVAQSTWFPVIITCIICSWGYWNWCFPALSIPFHSCKSYLWLMTPQHMMSFLYLDTICLYVDLRYVCDLIN